MRLKSRLLPISVLVFFTMIFSCDSTPKLPKETPLVIYEDSLTGLERAKEIRENTPAVLTKGLTMSLWASDSLAPDPIAMSIDNEGSIYLTRTNRQKNSEFDIRGYRDWMTPSISFQSVKDRRAFLHETFAPEKSEENSWLPDLNNDSIHDWKDLRVEKEEVWRLDDKNKDGLAETSTRILNDFNEEITDCAGALLVRDNDVFVGVGPDMWRLTDTNDDEVLDTKTSLAHGFAVHIGFGAHGMSGAIEGPDGKIYWGIGDIGANITKDGTNYKYPNQGIIVRANPDGSDFEIFAAGLRNTHEFVFDAYGNIISSDNDGDHRGESERLVHIVEGHDAGWRANWQYGKYTDPMNNGYNVWMDEKLYVPRWEGQAAYIIPPIQNFHNGPTGMVYNPGTALGKDWVDKFFLVEFVGNPTNSHIWSFSLKPKGASFELEAETDVVSGILPTGMRFGPDGALYAADWINGWGTKNYGRVWKFDVTDDKNDLASERKQTEHLITLDYSDQSADDLVKLLAYPDMRIRQKAQFELVNRGRKGFTSFKETLETSSDQFAKIHSIWGIGQLASKDLNRAEALIGYLKDTDSEIIAQSAKIIGDVKFVDAAAELIPLLKNNNPRVKFFAAQALGRIQYKEAVQPLLDMIAANSDTDVYLRHAAVLALSRIGEEAPIVALEGNPNRSLRIAAVLVLRRMQSPEVGRFLKDEDEYIVTEAARAINDDWSIEAALPALASLLNEERFSSEPLLRRSINAALRVGGEEELNNLIAFAKRQDVPSNLKGEALAAIGTWASPSVLDRVDGRYRGEIKRDAAPIKQKIEGLIPEFLLESDENILVAVSKTLSALGVDSQNDKLRKIMETHKSPSVRSAMLDALGKLNYENIESAMQAGMKDSDFEVRTTALGLLPELELDAKDLPAIVNPVFVKGSIREQQKMMGVLGEMPLDKTESVLGQMIVKAKSKKLPSAVILDLIEAVEASGSEKLAAELAPLKATGNTFEAFKETLEGGNLRQGWRFFNNNSTGQCVRCHSVGGSGGIVGPELDNIGNVLSREQLLEALIDPSKRLAPGYGTVTVTFKDGQVATGVLMEETYRELILRTTDAEPMEIAKERIKNVENSMSSMPPMGSAMSKREIRDVIEFLANLKRKDS
ncbi:HEAT repeat domain-containing protein [Maribacter halichondriae]|uniref:HEAT repeat domain-containing protein n=1 Tax=Maribacter halichondriae TaxID=2980554 RepID=UPI0023581228|nr:HEAT repeat domain-containing protein [Maribacter sp. Hal144]